MKKLGNFKVFGILADGSQIQLNEISILAKSDVIRDIGLFLINSAYEMEKNGVEHIHLQDFIKKFSTESHSDLVLVNERFVL